MLKLCKLLIERVWERIIPWETIVQLLWDSYQGRFKGWYGHWLILLLIWLWNTALLVLSCHFDFSDWLLHQYLHVYISPHLFQTLPFLLMTRFCTSLLPLLLLLCTVLRVLQNSHCFIFCFRELFKRLLIFLSDNFERPFFCNAFFGALSPMTKLLNFLRIVVCIRYDCTGDWCCSQRCCQLCPWLPLWWWQLHWVSGDLTILRTDTDIYHVETFFQLTVCQCGRFFLHKHCLWYLWQIWGMTKTEQILKKVNCIWRNETGKSSNASSFSETVYCLGSSAAQTQNFFAFAPISILLTILWYPYWNLLASIVFLVSVLVSVSSDQNNRVYSIIRLSIFEGCKSASQRNWSDCL